MFKNLIKNKLNIKKEDNLLVIEYRKWSFKLPIYLIIFYILYTWLGCKMREIEISTITLYLYNLPFLLIFVVVALIVCSKEILIVDNNELVIEKYFLFYLYERKVIDVLNIRSIFFANEYEKIFPLFLPLDIVKNLKIKVKESEIEDKIYTFGVNLDEEKYKEIVGEISKYNNIKISWSIFVKIIQRIVKKYFYNS